MRTIKFKGKRRDNGEWVSGDLAHSLNGNLNILAFDTQDGVVGFSGAYPVDPNTICQFAGMKDIEGNEVWEGDILDGGCREGAEALRHRDRRNIVGRTRLSPMGVALV